MKSGGLIHMINIKYIALIVVVLLILPTVIADFRTVTCKDGWFDSHLCKDNELQDEFNQVDSRNDQQDTSSREQIEYIRDNEAGWNKDIIGGGGGTSFSRVENWARTEFLDFLMGIFITHEAAHARMDILEARIIDLETGTASGYQNSMACKVSLAKANRLDEIVKFGEGWTATPGAEYCIGFIVVG